MVSMYVLSGPATRLTDVLTAKPSAHDICAYSTLGPLSSPQRHARVTEQVPHPRSLFWLRPIWDWGPGKQNECALLAPGIDFVRLLVTVNHHCFDYRHSIRSLHVPVSLQSPEDQAPRFAVALQRSIHHWTNTAVRTYTGMLKSYERLY